MAATPAYLPLYRSGELADRADRVQSRLAACDVCPRRCGADRREGRNGACRTGIRARLSSYGAHMGEEDPLRGRRGSGTVFFAGCNLGCQFCQNHDISQSDAGSEVTPQELAAAMLALQRQGCHNLNLVSPTHVAPQILAALQVAAGKGLRLPLVYNTGGYDSLDTLRLLDGLVDIYMPDMKYDDPALGLRYSGVPDYPEVNRSAVLEMHRQVGDLRIGPDGLATRGLLVRHLVLPGDLAGTKGILRFLSERVSPRTYLNLMDQYRPAFRARQYPELNRFVERSAFEGVVRMAGEMGILRLDGRRAPAGESS